MKKKLWLILLAVLIGVAGCGYGTDKGEAVGQVKWAEHVTPLICPEHLTAGISLGIIQGGSGSVSTHDVSVHVMNAETFKVLDTAAHSGRIVRFHYRARRATFCFPNLQILWAEIIQ